MEDDNNTACKLVSTREEITYDDVEKVADERMSTILDIEKYCIDEKEDLISGCEVCEDILKIIEELKNKKYYIKNTFTKRQIEDYKSRIEKAVEYVEKHKFNKFGDIDCGEAESIIDILNGRSNNE